MNADAFRLDRSHKRPACLRFRIAIVGVGVQLRLVRDSDLNTSSKTSNADVGTFGCVDQRTNFCEKISVGGR